MKYTFLSLIFFATIASCNNATEPSVTASGDTSKPVENKIMIPASSCYSTITGKDSIRLKVEKFENVVTGHLTYKIFEKDRNEGDLEGQFKGDTLVADYTFLSEGKLSTRQVIFLIKDSLAIEGYGEMEDKNGKMVFKNTNITSFNNGIKLQKIPCN